MAFAVVGSESNKMVFGHDGKLTKEQAEAAVTRKNAQAEKLGIKTRYKVDERDEADCKGIGK